MKKLHGVKFLWVGIVLVLGTLTMGVDKCGGPCIFQVDGNLQTVLHSKNMCLLDSGEKCIIQFDKDGILSLKTTGIIGLDGEENDVNVKPLEINVAASKNIVFKVDSNFQSSVGLDSLELKLDSEKKCALIIHRNNVHIKNITIDTLDTEHAFCIYGKNVVLEDINVINSSVVLLDKATTTLTNVTTDEKSTITAGAGTAVACTNGAFKDGKCVLCTAGENLENGICVSKCKEVDGEVWDSISGTCVLECPGQNEVKKDGACACVEGYGRYDAGKPCVACGSNGKVVNGQCECFAGYHRDLDGHCDVDDQKDINKCDDPNAVVNDTGTCVCKDCFDYTWNTSSPAAIAAGPNCSTAIPDCEPTLSCGAGFVANEAGTACVEEPPAASTKGECGCNLNVGETTTAQKVLPYFMIALSGFGLKMWRRKRL